MAILLVWIHVLSTFPPIIIASFVLFEPIRVGEWVPLLASSPVDDTYNTYKHSNDHYITLSTSENSSTANVQWKSIFNTISVFAKLI